MKNMSQVFEAEDCPYYRHSVHLDRQEWFDFCLDPKRENVRREMCCFFCHVFDCKNVCEKVRRRASGK